MSDNNRFKEELMRIGFSSFSARLLVGHGFDSIATLRLATLADIEKVTVNTTETVEEPGGKLAPCFPFVAVKKLKALREWAEYHDARGSQARLEEFVDPVITKWLQRVDEIELYDRIYNQQSGPATNTLKLDSIEQWFPFKRNFTSLMMNTRSNWGTRVPLAYLLRDKEDVDAGIFTKAFMCIDDDLVDTQRMCGRLFDMDNKCLWMWLRSCVRGDVAQLIQRYSTTQNGRAAWNTLKKLGESRSAKACLSAKADAIVKKTEFPGSPSYTIEQHVLRFIEAFNIMEEINEPYPDGYKIFLFQNSLKDRASSLVTLSGFADNAKDENFETFSKYVIDCVGVAENWISNNAVHGAQKKRKHNQYRN